MGDACYKAFTNRVSWNDADYHCKALGHNVYLATVNSMAEQNFMETQMEICKLSGIMDADTF